MISAFGVDHGSVIFKKATRHDASGAAIASAGAVTATTGLVGGGLALAHKKVEKSAGDPFQISKAGRTAAVEAVRWGSGLTAAGGGITAGSYTAQRKQGTKRKDATRTAALTGAGALAGQGVYQSAGYGTKHAALSTEKKVSRSQRDKQLKPVKAARGAFTPAMERHYPKTLPGWQAHRVLGLTHRGKVGTAVGAAFTLGGAAAAAKATSRKKDR